MRSRVLKILALAVCLGLLPGAAYAKGGKGGGPPADKGRSSSGHSVQDKDKDKDRQHDEDRDDHHAGRRHDHEREAAAGPSNRPPGWDKGNKTGWGDCNVPPGLAKKRGCDSHGLSTRERAARRNQTGTTRTTTASTSRVSQPGQTRGIILQKNGSQAATRTTTASTPKATQAGQSRGIILQKGTTKPATQTRTAEQK